jgi:predicted dehydrogenase
MNKPNVENSEVNRRDFLKGSSVATLMAMMGGVPLIAQPATEERKTDAPVELSKAKVAVIGLGPWGRDILDQLGRLKRAEVVAICDNYPAMLRKSASKVPNAAKVEDYKAVLANKDVTAVVVATGTHQHKEIVIEALNAGKHVYCEAPLANSIEDAKAIALAARDAAGQVFQPGLQYRSDPQRLFLLPFVRSGQLGRTVMARAQWHKKTSWRQTSPNAEREKAINWRLSKATSTGLMGEIGIHQLDQVQWFLNELPTAVHGFGSLIFWKDDGRDVADTAQLVVEYPGGVRMMYDVTIVNSFDGEYDMYYGSDAAVMMRENKVERADGYQYFHLAWMFKEVDSPMLGWEVYARKDAFFNETGIALVAGGSKQTALANKGAEESPFPFTTLYYALESFVGNAADMTDWVKEFKANYANADRKVLAEYIAGQKLYNPAATIQDGYAATVLAIKANEAVVNGGRIELKKEWFELA